MSLRETEELDRLEEEEVCVGGGLPMLSLSRTLRALPVKWCTLGSSPDWLRHPRELWWFALVCVNPLVALV